MSMLPKLSCKGKGKLGNKMIYGHGSVLSQCFPGVGVVASKACKGLAKPGGHG